MAPGFRAVGQPIPKRLQAGAVGLGLPFGVLFHDLEADGSQVVLAFDSDAAFLARRALFADQYFEVANRGVNPFRTVVQLKSSLAPCI
jgi:hypothetical protein